MFPSVQPSRSATTDSGTPAMSIWLAAVWRRFVEPHAEDPGLGGVALPGVRRPAEVPVRDPAVVGEHERLGPEPDTDRFEAFSSHNDVRCRASNSVATRPQGHHVGAVGLRALLDLAAT